MAIDDEENGGWVTTVTPAEPEPTDEQLLGDLRALGQPRRRQQGPTRQELLAELDALQQPRRRQQDAVPDQAAPEEPQPGQSELARELTASGFIDELGRRFALQRQEEERQALTESASRGVLSWLSEAGRGIPRGAVFNTPGLAMQGAAASDPGEAAASVFDRYREQLLRVPQMSDAEVVLLQHDIRRQWHMRNSAAVASLNEAIAGLRDGTLNAETLAQRFPPLTPLANRPAYQAGTAWQQRGRDLIPIAPGWEESYAVGIGEGLGTLLAGLPVALTGAGPSMAFFATLGVGEAAERAERFHRTEVAAGRPGLSEEQIAAAAILGAGPGLTDVAPLEIMLGRLRLPVPSGALGTVAQAIGRVGGAAFLRVLSQAAIEGGQELTQEFLQNLIAQQQYNPGQPLTEGLMKSWLTGSAVGGIAQSGQEMFRLGARRGGRGGAHEQQPQAPPATAPPQPATAPAPATPPPSPEAGAPKPGAEEPTPTPAPQPAGEEVFNPFGLPMPPPEEQPAPPPGEAAAPTPAPVATERRGSLAEALDGVQPEPAEAVPDAFGFAVCILQEGDAP